MTNADYTSMADEDLFAMIDEGRSLIAGAKVELAGMEMEVSRRKEMIGADLFRAQHKEHGSATFTDEGGRKFKVEARRDVKWDSPKLQAIASSMPWPEVERTFDIKFTVPERVYTSMADMHLRAQLDSARTTKTGELRVVYLGHDVGNED